MFKTLGYTISCWKIQTNFDSDFQSIVTEYYKTLLFVEKIKDLQTLADFMAVYMQLADHYYVSFLYFDLKQVSSITLHINNSFNWQRMHLFFSNPENDGNIQTFLLLSNDERIYQIKYQKLSFCSSLAFRSRFLLSL